MVRVSFPATYSPLFVVFTVEFASRCLGELVGYAQTAFQWHASFASFLLPEYFGYCLLYLGFRVEAFYSFIGVWVGLIGLSLRFGGLVYTLRFIFPY